METCEEVVVVVEGDCCPALGALALESDRFSSSTSSCVEPHLFSSGKWGQQEYLPHKSIVQD